MFAFYRGKPSVLWALYSLLIYTRLIMSQDFLEYSCRRKYNNQDNKIRKLYILEKGHQLPQNICVGILTKLPDSFRSFIVQDK